MPPVKRRPHLILHLGFIFPSLFAPTVPYLTLSQKKLSCAKVDCITFPAQKSPIYKLLLCGLTSKSPRPGAGLSCPSLYRLYSPASLDSLFFLTCPGLGWRLYASHPLKNSLQSLSMKNPLIFLRPCPNLTPCMKLSLVPPRL